MIRYQMHTAALSAFVSLIIWAQPPFVAAQSASLQTNDQLKRSKACEAVDQLILEPLDKALGRGGFMFECEAIPAGEMLTVFGRLLVSGTGGPTQARFQGSIKPSLEGNLKDWTLCQLSINNEQVDLPEC